MGNVDFVWDGRQLRDMAAFDSYLSTLGKRGPAWVKGIVIHHTEGFRASWNGKVDMPSLMATYKAKPNWTAGPHLFNAPDGIWVGTPPNQVGIHAGDWNARTLGIEIVGNYDRETMLPDLRNRAFCMIRSLMRWCELPFNDITANTVPGHRECSWKDKATGTIMYPPTWDGKGIKTCPGRNTDMNVFRTDLARFLRTYRASSTGANVYNVDAPSRPRKIVGKLNRAALVQVTSFTYGGSWALLDSKIPRMAGVPSGPMYVAKSDLTDITESPGASNAVILQADAWSTSLCGR